MQAQHRTETIIDLISFKQIQLEVWKQFSPSRWVENLINQRDNKRSEKKCEKTMVVFKTANAIQMEVFENM